MVQMNDTKKTRTTGNDRLIALHTKRSNVLTAKIAKLTKERDAHDKARAALVEATEADEVTKVA